MYCILYYSGYVSFYYYSKVSNQALRSQAKPIDINERDSAFHRLGNNPIEQKIEE